MSEDSNEKKVWMKCPECGYEEEVQEWFLEVIRDFYQFDPQEGYKMFCPHCKADMKETVSK